ncbi:protease sohB family protein [Nitzschia inconspicua]|uniref:Protease sohB family protein n=1 Tax=Nitzschia inconspicua TaxID=303405 RepID=A0A9K3L8H5_9STRA|nr:protease sohB family protein [Nitzschia inconspicua]
MGRFKPEDFGYDFAVEKEETEALVTTTTCETSKNASISVEVQQPTSTIIADISAQSSTDPSPVTEGDAGYKLYEEKEPPKEAEKEDDDFHYQPEKRYRGGESFIVTDDSSSGGTTINGIACIGALCCCLTVALVIAGGILISYEEYKDSESALLAGAILIVFAVGACLCGCCSLCLGVATDGVNLGSSGSSDSSKGDPNYKEVKVRLRRLNDRYENGCMNAESSLKKVRLDVVGHMKEFKEAVNKEEKTKKEKEKKNMEELEKRVKKDIESGVPVKEIRRKYRPVTFFIDFHGDLMVSKLELLRKQVSVVVSLAKPGHDKCVVSLTSPGGAVSQYGLAASQLVRIRKAGIHLTVCVDSIAASGGYMMASVADQIYAAPFAVVGSIGVVTQIPNFQRFLNEHKVDAYLMTAGNYKRTIDVIGEVTEEGKAKLTEQLDDIHVAFKDHIALARPKLRENIEKVGTGEHWLAVQAKELGLVDEIMTSDEYLERISSECDIIEILEKIQSRKSPLQMFGDGISHAAKSLTNVASQIQSTAEGQSPTPMAIV